MLQLAVPTTFSRANKRVVEAIDAEPVNASNPRRGRRKIIKHAKRLKTR